MFNNVALKKYSKKIGWIVLLFILSSVFLVALNYSKYSTFLKSDVIPGWDGASHEAIGHYYADNIFPNTWGWVPNWFAGMPFPQFYPPVFYFLVATIYHLFNIPYLVAFKTFIFILLSAVPLTNYALVYKYTRKKLISFFAAFLTILFLSINNSTLGNYGLTLEGVFNNGLITQLPGFVFLSLWIYYFLDVEEKTYSRYISGFFLFLIFLTSVHIVINAAIFFIVTYCYKVLPFYKDKKAFYSKTKLYLLLGSIPLLSCAFWYFPLIYYYSFALARSLEYGGVSQGSFIDLFSIYFFVIIFFIFSGGIALKSKKRNVTIIAISSLLPFLLSTGFLSKLFPALPLHDGRWVAVSYLLSPFAVAYVANAFCSLFKKKIYKYSVVGILVVIFTLNWALTISFQTLEGFSLGKEHLFSREIASFISNQQGMISVEVHTPYREPVDRIINAITGEFGGQSIYTVFRESSISSIFMTPLRNTFSRKAELWGIRTLLANEDLISAQGMDKKLDRARWMGLEYFLVRTKDYHEAFTTSPLVHKVTDFGPWSLYALNQHIERAEALHYNPVLVFSVLDFKTFDFSRQDYVRLAEEAFFADRFDPALVFADAKYIDEYSNLQQFSAIILSDYVYHNKEKALELLKVYSATHPLIVVESDDLLYKQLSELDTLKDNIHIIKAVRSDATYVEKNISNLSKRVTLHPEIIKSMEPVRSRAGEMFGIIDEGKEEVNESEITLEYKPSMKGKRIDIIFASSTPTDIPVYIKQSYFPTWQRTDGEKVYLASPTYMLTYAHDSFTLEFKDPWILSLGRFVSVIVLIITIFLFVRDRKLIFSSQKI